ncbi:tetratricopeptide repeat protein [Goodfellowiella coeruleoviolacea]|uniref:Tetratricopeptide repeat-containing protein n=1 Tax=Goodfellowiella coeruleoviolacea TaxID=334858 RepID=A0AAE3GPR0_9PSEU|nr:hypothetical protein [Goodfellowiella coeruleoviolacea]MCP2169918.1 Tetratricopeptide repeat-containing protein [Goodfellowiella coeruleoviolacea]
MAISAPGADDGLASLRQAAEADRPGAARHLGHQLSLLGSGLVFQAGTTTPQAEHWLRRALDLDPDDALAAVLLADLLVRRADLTTAFWQGSDQGERTELYRQFRAHRDEALHWYRHALAVAPSSTAAITGLAMLLSDDLRWGRRFLEPEDTDPDDRPTRLAEAAHWWRRELSAHPDNATATCQLADVLARNGQQAEAAHWLRRTVELDPQNWRAALDLSRHAAQGADCTTAERACRELAEAGDPQAVISLALLLESTGRTAAADSWLQRPTARPLPRLLFDSDPTPSSVLTSLARKLLDHDDVARAKWWCLVALRRTPSSHDAMELFKVLPVDEQDTATVVTWLTRAANAGDQRAVGYLTELVREQDQGAGPAQTGGLLHTAVEHGGTIDHIEGVLRQRPHQI